MNDHVAAYQCDFFADPTPIFKPAIKPDPLPDPMQWSEAVRDKMVDALIELACDSRQNDKMPESLMDCATLISDRLRNRRIDTADYFATLGWVMELWDGAIPYRFVCGVNGVDPETLQYVIQSTPLLKYDFAEVRRHLVGTLL
ncbi:hypothetical protein JOE11_004931 [Robbsia andropogonis]|uniref:hypothetical protein n=1 Tax=Robbsia andropogonis TaxID=28092 RepID=UPI003D20B375